MYVRYSNNVWIKDLISLLRTSPSLPSVNGQTLDHRGSGIRPKNIDHRCRRSTGGMRTEHDPCVGLTTQLLQGEGATKHLHLRIDNKMKKSINATFILPHGLSWCVSIPLALSTLRISLSVLDEKRIVETGCFLLNDDVG